MTVDTRQLRDALGHFATGVTVVTLWHDGEVHGMTANSFTSVSLDPPLLLVNIAKGNRTHDLVTQIGRFGVNILGEEHEDVSTHFAQAGERETPESIRFQSSNGGSPIMDGAIAWFDCTVWNSYDGGDHTIFVGHVDHFDAPGGKPLLFFKGRYGKIDG